MKPILYKVLAIISLVLIVCSALGIGSSYLCVNEFNNSGCSIASVMFAPLSGGSGDGLAVLFFGVYAYATMGLIGLSLLLIIWVQGRRDLVLRPRPKTLLLITAIIILIAAGLVAKQRIYEGYVLPGEIEQNFADTAGIPVEELHNAQCPGGLLGVALVRYPNCPACDAAEDALRTLGVNDRVQVYNLAAPETLPDPYSGVFTELRDILFARISTLYQLQKHRSLYSEPGGIFRSDVETSGVLVSVCGGDMLFDFTGKTFDLTPVQRELDRRNQ